MRRRAFAAVAVFLALGVGAWLWLDRRGGGDGAEDSTAGRGDDVDAGSPTLAGRAGASAADGHVGGGGTAGMPEMKAEISGRVTDAGGQGLPGHTLTVAWGSPPSSKANPGPSTESGADGGFRLVGLALGVHLIRVSGTPGAFFDAWITAPTGGETVEIRLRPAIVADVKVLDWEERPLAGADVEALGAERDEPMDPFRPKWKFRTTSCGGARSESDGLARLQMEVDAKPDRLSVRGPEARDDLLPIVDRPWDGRATTIRMERAFKVAGTVLDSAGRPLRRVQVAYRVGGAWTDARPSADGTFTIRGLAAGRVALRAALEGSPLDDTAATVTVEAGDEKAKIFVDTSGELVVKFESWVPTFIRTARVTPDVGAGGGAPPDAIKVEVSFEGVARFRGLRSGTAYVLWSPPDDDGLMAYRRGVHTTDSPLAVPLERGKTVKVHWHAGFEVHRPVIIWASGPGISGLLGENGEIRGLPDGSWKIQVWTEPGTGFTDPVSAGEATAEAGGSVDIALVPAR